MKKLAILFVAVMVCGVALIGWMIWNDHRQLEREVTSQFDISPRFAEMAKQCEEKVPCKDDVQIAFVQSISTLADAAKAYELAEGNCVFGEVRSMVELRSEQLLWPALSEARSFEEHAGLLPLAKNTRYLQQLCWGLADAANTLEQFKQLLDKSNEFCNKAFYSGCPGISRETECEHPWLSYVKYRRMNRQAVLIGEMTSLADVLRVYRNELVTDCALDTLSDKVLALAPTVRATSVDELYEVIWMKASDRVGRGLEDRLGEHFARAGLPLVLTLEDAWKVAHMAEGSSLEDEAEKKWRARAIVEIGRARRAQDLKRLREIQQFTPPEESYLLTHTVAEIYGVAQ